MTQDVVKAAPEGAGAPEIEITPEMVAAGVLACERWKLADEAEWKVFDIYREMERARRAKANPCPAAAAAVAADAA